MPRVKTQVARNDIYRYGAKVPSDKTKSGFRHVSSQPRDENDDVIIKKGQTYYTWSFPFGGTFKQLTKPKRSQLTQSDFLSQWYDLQDGAAEEDPADLNQLEDIIQNFMSEIEMLRDEQEEKRDNMPESLQDSFSGEILQERYDALDELYNELDAIECDSEVEKEEVNEEDYEDSDEYEEAVRLAEQEYEDNLATELSDKLSEFQDAVDNCSL